MKKAVQEFVLYLTISQIIQPPTTMLVKFRAKEVG
jgi:hypothetical protein